MTRLIVGVCVGLLAMMPHGGAQAADLRLTRVVLSTGGVGYFEYQAEVDGAATLGLEVPLDQVDDVLKSVVVFDSAGAVGSAQLPGREPLDRLFRDLPFGADALAAPEALLGALRGAEVELVGARTLRGRVIAVVLETVALPDGLGVTLRHRVTLMTDEGMAQAILEDTDRVAFLDPGLGAEVDAALAALAAHRVHDQRTIDINLPGSGKRTVSVGYVVAVPLWKASYRAVIPAEGETKGQVQGWAHVENMSGIDWDGVRLTLVSGNPVTFRQALYQAYYVPRPEVPVEVAGRVMPGLDEGTVALMEQEAAKTLRRAESKDELDAAGAALADMAAVSGEMMAMAPAPAEARNDLFASYHTVAGTEAATQVVFPVAEPVTVADGNSVMIPIVQALVPMERLALYQPATHGRHPVASLRIANDGASLPPGVATLYEQGADGVTFVGDARVPALPAGDSRLLNYALDQKTTVDREDQQAQSIGRVKAHDGILEIEAIERLTTLYRVAAPAAEARHIVLEHERLPGWDLARPKGDNVELTDTAHRIPLDVAAGEQASVEVVLERTAWQGVRLADLSVDELAYYAAGEGLSAEARKALESLFTLRSQVDRAREAIVRLDTQRARLFEDQARIRENLYRVPEGTDIARQYLEKLDAQEAELGALETAYDKASETLATLEATLAEQIGSLTLE
jgi:hypothetical protein